MSGLPPSPLEAEALRLMDCDGCPPFGKSTGQCINLLIVGAPLSGKSYLIKSLLSHLHCSVVIQLSAGVLSRDSGAVNYADVLDSAFARLVAAARDGARCALVIEDSDAVLPTSATLHRKGPADLETEEIQMVRAFMRGWLALVDECASLSCSYAPSVLLSCSSLASLHPAVRHCFGNRVLDLSAGSTRGVGSAHIWMTEALALVCLPVSQAMQSTELTLAPGLAIRLIEDVELPAVLQLHGNSLGPADCESVAKSAACVVALLLSRRLTAARDSAPCTAHVIDLRALLSRLLSGYIPLSSAPVLPSLSSSNSSFGASSTTLSRVAHLLPGLIEAEDNRSEWARPTSQEEMREEAAVLVAAITGGAMAFAGESRAELMSASRGLATGEAGQTDDDGDDGDTVLMSSGRINRKALAGGMDYGISWDSVRGQNTAKAALARALSTMLPAGLSADLHSVGTGTEQTPTDPLAKYRAALRSRVRTSKPCGVLLYGPPGTGKTLLARAVAGTACARFLPLSIPSLLRAGVGDSERALIAAFARATAAAPCVVFLDEVQALFTARAQADGGDEASRMSAMLTAALLSCVDALSSRREDEPPVLVLAATNAPWALDPSLLTPSRLGVVIYVGLPNEDERADVLAVRLASMPIKASHPHSEAASPSEVLALCKQLACSTKGFSAADLANLCRLAASRAVALADAHHQSAPTLTAECFKFAVGRMMPSVDPVVERSLQAFSAMQHTA